MAKFWQGFFILQVWAQSVIFSKIFNGWINQKTSRIGLVPLKVHLSVDFLEIIDKFCPLEKIFLSAIYLLEGEMADEPIENFKAKSDFALAPIHKIII